MPYGGARWPYVRHTRPSVRRIMLAGLPVPRSGAGTVSSAQLLPSSTERYVSIHAFGLSRRRIAVSNSVGPSRTVDGMIAYPVGSGPIQETNAHVLPPSVVRTHSG